jgi:hypothetical protein
MFAVRRFAIALAGALFFSLTQRSDEWEGLGARKYSEFN